MLFLMNDVVLKPDARPFAPPMSRRHSRALSFDFVQRLGAELFAEQPLMQAAAPERAARLAALIVATAPQINAALFVAPAADCSPDQVSVRFAEISFDVMSWLYAHQQAGQLNTLVADRQVWRRLAA